MRRAGRNQGDEDKLSKKEGVEMTDQVRAEGTFCLSESEGTPAYIAKRRAGQKQPKERSSTEAYRKNR